jgi:hypothetical protein
MKSESIDYWMNRLERNSQIEPKDENEYSFMQIAEFLLSRENKKKTA